MGYNKSGAKIASNAYGAPYGKNARLLFGRDERFLLVEVQPQSPQNTESVFWKRWNYSNGYAIFKSLRGTYSIRLYYSVSSPYKCFVCKRSTTTRLAFP